MILCLPLQNTKKTQSSMAWKPQRNLCLCPWHLLYSLKYRATPKRLCLRPYSRRFQPAVLAGAAIKGSPLRLSSWVCSDRSDTRQHVQGLEIRLSRALCKAPVRPLACSWKGKVQPLILSGCQGSAWVGHRCSCWSLLGMWLSQ